MKKIFEIIKRIPTISSMILIVFIFIFFRIFIYLSSDGKWVVDEYGVMNFIEKDGSIAKNKFIKYLNREYYVDENSQKVFQKWIDNNKRFIDNTGVLLKNQFASYIEGLNGLYYFDENGYILNRGLHIINGDEYYIKEDGSVVNETFFDIPGEHRYVYINSNGVILKEPGKKVIANNEYFVENNGNILRNQWFEYDGNTLYLNDKGLIAKNCWIGDTYYIDNDGKLLKNGFAPTGEKLDKDGKIIIKNTFYDVLNGKIVGDEVVLGKYYKDNDKDLVGLEWKILEIDENKAFLITKNVIDCVKFNEYYYETVWETSSLRKWLNGYFIDKVFNKNESNFLELRDVDNEGNYIYGIDDFETTKDKVFVLSKNEHRKFFGKENISDGQNLIAATVPTKYAISNGAYCDKDDTKLYCGNSMYWLRNPGLNLNYTQVSIFTGGIDIMGYINDANCIGIRPCIIVNYGLK